MVIPIERLRREAAQAARHYSDINAACPYPFHTDAAQAFKAFFHQALAEQPPQKEASHFKKRHDNVLRAIKNLEGDELPALARLEGGAP